MREIVLDTETTGLDHATGDRVVEIGCVELVNHFPTGRTFHEYINPERDMPREAEAVHGLSAAFLADKPVFAAIADAFWEFIGDAHLVIHNATFDVGFLAAEYRRLGRGFLPPERVVDTLMLARRRNPGGPNSLDELCRRFGVDNSRRTMHGALLDAELLSEVYIELLGGRQARLTLVEETSASMVAGRAEPRVRQTPLSPRLDADARRAHAAFVAAELGDNAIWLGYPAEDG